MLIKSIKNIGFVCLGSIIGFYTTSYEYFKFATEINLIDFANLVFTVLLGLYIGLVVQRHQANERIEKDILIAEISQIKSEMNSVNLNISKNTLLFEDTVLSFKMASTTLSALEKLVVICNIKNKSTEIRDLDMSMRKLKQIATNANVINGNIQISNIDKLNFTREYNIFKEKILKLIVSINRN